MAEWQSNAVVLGVVTGRCDGWVTEQCNGVGGCHREVWWLSDRAMQWCWGLSQGGVMAEWQSNAVVLRVVIGRCDGWVTEQCSGVGGCHREVWWLSDRAMQWCWGLSQGGVMAEWQSNAVVLGVVIGRCDGWVTEQCSGVEGCHREVWWLSDRAMQWCWGLSQGGVMAEWQSNAVVLGVVTGRCDG